MEAQQGGVSVSPHAQVSRQMTKSPPGTQQGELITSRPGAALNEIVGSAQNAALCKRCLQAPNYATLGCACWHHLSVRSRSLPCMPKTRLARESGLFQRQQRLPRYLLYDLVCRYRTSSKCTAKEFSSTAHVKRGNPRPDARIVEVSHVSLRQIKPRRKRYGFEGIMGHKYSSWTC